MKFQRAVPPYPLVRCHGNSSSSALWSKGLSSSVYLKFVSLNLISWEKWDLTKKFICLICHTEKLKFKIYIIEVEIDDGDCGD